MGGRGGRPRRVYIQAGRERKKGATGKTTDGYPRTDDVCATHTVVVRSELQLARRELDFADNPGGPLPAGRDAVRSEWVRTAR